VLADPVAIVDQVARGRSVLGRQVDVARVAAARVPRFLVLVTAEARRHLREERLGARLGDSAVAANAVSVDDGVVLGVLEAKVLARQPCPLAHRGLPVAPAARAFVVRLRVTPAALGVGRQMERAGVPRALDPFMADDAVDPLVHVCAMLERMRGAPSRKPEDADARGERKREWERDRQPEKALRAHRISRVRDRRASAFTS